MVHKIDDDGTGSGKTEMMFGLWMMIQNPTTYRLAPSMARPAFDPHVWNSWKSCRSHQYFWTFLSTIVLPSTLKLQEDGCLITYVSYVKVPDLCRRYVRSSLIHSIAENPPQLQQEAFLIIIAQDTAALVVFAFLHPLHPFVLPAFTTLVSRRF